VRIFKNSWFSRFADKEGITDSELKEAVNLLEADQAVDLGGGVYKMRLARAGESKAGGYRVIVFFRSEKRTFYEYAFAKSNRGNINERQLKNFKKSAKVFLSSIDEQIENKKRKRDLIEIL